MIVHYTLWLQITHYDCKLHTMIVHYTLWLQITRYDCKLHTKIVNYNRKTFIVQDIGLMWQHSQVIYCFEFLTLLNTFAFFRSSSVKNANN